MPPCRRQHAAAADPDDVLRLHLRRRAAGDRHRRRRGDTPVLGPAVFFGMLGVTGLGLIFTPVFLRRRARSVRQAKEARTHRLSAFGQDRGVAFLSTARPISPAERNSASVHNGLF